MSTAKAVIWRIYWR